MTNAIAIDEWLDAIDREYLATYVGEGGAAIKFVVTDDDRRPALIEALKDRCGKLGYAFAHLDAIERRVHMPQDIFWGIAAQIGWRALARKLILRLLAGKRYHTDGVDPNDDADVIGAVAAANGGLDPQFVFLQLGPDLQKQVFKNANMARTFRVAMTHLCLIEMEAGMRGRYTGQPLLDWLKGVDPRIGNVRPFHIHTGINRTTARYFIESVLYWVRHAGYSGTVILLDNTRVTLARNPRDGRRHYTKAMTMDHYEMLREFIDDVDRMSGTLLTVATNHEFIDDQSARGWGIYDALRTRVMDDVRDRNVVNPLAALVRLS